MKLAQARMVLVGVFLGSMAIQAIAFFRASPYMWPEDLQALILKLLAVYSVHLGVIAGGMFAKSGLRDPKPSGVATISAILLAVVWNLLLVVRSLSFAGSRQDSAADLIKYLGTVADSGSFLVAAALAYFFAKNKEMSPKHSR